MIGRLDLVAAADYLRFLLNNEPAYKTRWEANQRRPGGSPNVDAVSAVLVEYLWTYDHDREPPSERSMRDTVRRALRAQAFTRATAELFIHAFHMKSGHGRHLLELLERVGEKPSAPTPWSAGTEQRPERPYRTVSLQELHTVGADGVPVEHRTIQVVQALQDGVEGHVYTFDTPDVDVRVIAGARSGPIQPSSVPGFWQCRFKFARPLRTGEVQIFEYATRFTYIDPPASEMRRGSVFLLQNLGMRVQFHPNRIPATVWWCSWAEPAAEAVRQEQAHLDHEHAVHQYVSAVQGSLVGFAWQWA